MNKDNAESDMQSGNIALWGANGFIGRHVAAYYADKSVDMKLFARNFDGFPFKAFTAKARYCYDFHNVDAFVSELQDCQTLILAVSASGARTFCDDLEAEITCNFVPHKALFDALSMQDHSIEHIIFLSSGGTIYGDIGHHTADEDTIKQPISPYGQVKLDIEREIIAQSAAAAWDYTILRVANPVGRWSKGKGLVNAILSALRDDVPMHIQGKGEAIRDYFDARDLARVIELARITPAARNQIYNIGSGAGLSINQVIELAEQVTDKRVQKNYIESLATDVHYNVLNTHKAEQQLGWRAEISLTKSIESMWSEE